MWNWVSSIGYVSSHVKFLLCFGGQKWSIRTTNTEPHTSVDYVDSYTKALRKLAGFEVIAKKSPADEPKDSAKYSLVVEPEE